VSVCVSLSCWADGVGRGGASSGYVHVLNSRCSSSDHCNKLQALTAVLTGQQSSRLDLLFDLTLVNIRPCPGPFIPTLQLPTHARTRRLAPSCWQICAMCLPACRDICCIALTIIAVLQRLDVFYSEISTRRSGNTDTLTSAAYSVQLKALNSYVIAICLTHTTNK
jgi:hypothetical protein